MSQFWSKVVHDLKPYVAGEQPKLNDIIKLNTNENPYPPSPKALAALAALAQASLGDLRLYPDPNATELKAAICDFYGVTPQQIFVGNGSDEVLGHAFLGLLKHDLPILFPDVTYSFYPVYCGLYEIAYQTVALSDDLSLRMDDYLGPNGGIIFPNPNAPTGRLLPLSDIEKLLRAHPTSVVIVDEAYVDFGGESAVKLVAQFPNLLVVQTLSKSRALAGLRVGFAIGHPDLITALERVKDSFNSYPLDRLALAVSAQAIADRAYFEQICAAVIATREAFSVELQALGFEVVPSAANFLLARHPQHDARDIQAFLRSRNIIVRHFNQPRIVQFLRITIGTDAQCARLVDALTEYLSERANSVPK